MAEPAGPGGRTGRTSWARRNNWQNQLVQEEELAEPAGPGRTGRTSWARKNWQNQLG